MHQSPLDEKNFDVVKIKYKTFDLSLKFDIRSISKTEFTQFVKSLASKDLLDPFIIGKKAPFPALKGVVFTPKLKKNVLLPNENKLKLSPTQELHMNLCLDHYRKLGILADVESTTHSKAFLVPKPNKSIDKDETDPSKIEAAYRMVRVI